MSIKEASFVVFCVMLELWNSCGAVPSNSIWHNEPDSSSCRCNTGYEQHKVTLCLDVNECDFKDEHGNKTCGPDATCINTRGSYQCNCNVGFKKNGTECYDVNECDFKDEHGNKTCGPDATCINTRGSYQCNCNVGFKKNGTECYDVNECDFKDEHGNKTCGPDATCINTRGSYQCNCNVGFKKNGTECYDVNECDFKDEHGNKTCGPDATCINTRGSYQCNCNVGFKKNGTECYDVNECNGLPSLVCDEHATCFNIPGSYMCTCNAGYQGDGYTCISYVLSDCADIRAQGHNTSGVYTVNIGDTKRPLAVYCDMKTRNLGWTVFQRRQDGSVDFYLGWAQYQTGFGDVNKEFWIGNENLHLLTAGKRYKLRVELTAFDGSTAYAEFDNFQVASAADKYRLSSVGKYSGTAGDERSFSYHVGQRFSTKDQDNDSASGENCAERCKGGWWYNNCYYSNLNGKYHKTETIGADSVAWVYWKNTWASMKRSEMKITPFV